MEEIFQELHQNQLDTSDTDGWSSSSDEVPEKRRRLSLPTKHPKKSPAPVMYDAYSITTFIVMWLVNNNKWQLFWVSFFVTAMLKDFLGKDLNDILNHQNLQMFFKPNFSELFSLLHTENGKAERIHTEWQNHVCGYAVALYVLKAGLVKSGCSQMNKASSLSLCLCCALALWLSWTCSSMLISFLYLDTQNWLQDAVLQVWAQDQSSLLIVQPST